MQTWACWAWWRRMRWVGAFWWWNIGSRWRGCCDVAAFLQYVLALMIKRNGEANIIILSHLLLREFQKGLLLLRWYPLCTITRGVTGFRQVGFGKLYFGIEFAPFRQLPKRNVLKSKSLFRHFQIRQLPKSCKSTYLFRQDWNNEFSVSANKL